MNDPKLKILDKSKELFGQFGYQKTTLTDIAKSVGKVKTAIYYYFSGKEEIFASLVQQEAASFLEQLMTATNQHDDPVEQLEAYVNARIELMQKISNRYKFLKKEFFELMPIVEEHRKEADQQELEFVAAILRAIERHSHRKVTDPTFAAKMLVNNLKGLEIQMYVTDQILVDELDKKQFTQFILYGIVSSEAHLH